MLAGCKDLASPLSCTARLIYKTAVYCEKSFLKSFMGNEKPDCGYVQFVNKFFIYFGISFVSHVWTNHRWLQLVESSWAAIAAR